jgi:hypothetical protein
MLDHALTVLTLCTALLVVEAMVFGLWWGIRYRKRALEWDAVREQEKFDELVHTLPMTPEEVQEWENHNAA